jgi:hypothetical protein
MGGLLPAAGLLNVCRYLLRDRDAKVCVAFTGIREAVGIKSMNAHVERCQRSVKDACLSKRVLFGMASLRQVLSDYVYVFMVDEATKAKGMGFSFQGGGPNR